MIPDEESAFAIEVHALTERIRPLLARHSPHVVLSVLGDLLAMLLAGTYDLRSREATELLREQLLSGHMDYVRKLIPANEHELRGTVQ